MTAALSSEPTFRLAPEFRPGTSPLLVSVPHAGTGLPEGMQARLSDAATNLPDTDWFVDRLYEFATGMGAGLLVARASRLVVDLNRPPDDQPLYESSQTRLMTGVIPMQCFSGMPVYLPGTRPNAIEIAARLENYWQPYHRQLRSALDRIREQHGYAIVLDAHSIRSQVPLLFEGVLPDLNLGSNNGRSAAPDLLQAATLSLRAGNRSLVVDGRFKGGYITRHYGRPGQNIHALQLEIAQHGYLDEATGQIPPAWNPVRANSLQLQLQDLVETLIHWKPRHG